MVLRVLRTWILALWLLGQGLWSLFLLVRNLCGSTVSYCYLPYLLYKTRFALSLSHHPAFPAKTLAAWGWDCGEVRVRVKNLCSVFLALKYLASTISYQVIFFFFLRIIGFWNLHLSPLLPPQYPYFKGLFHQNLGRKHCRKRTIKWVQLLTQNVTDSPLHIYKFISKNS